MNLMPGSHDEIAPAGPPSGALFDLPLVSVIVVNYNYGHLLGEAVASVFNQTYPELECIIVDNASTDDSAAVIERLSAAHPDLKILRRSSNDGQTAASLDGFALSTGQYVIFLDADDALLPHCVASHIEVHLASRIHVGFTAADMLQVVDGQLVVTTGEAMNLYIRSGKGRRADLLRPFVLPGTWPCKQAVRNEDLAAKVHYVPPLCTRWVWTPTSGLCFRRDAVALFADNEEVRYLRTGTDMYFAHGIGGWCGSLLIDEPLFMYRLHGANSLTRRAQLHRSLSYTPGSSGDNNDRAKALIIDQLTRHSGRFSQNLLFKLNHLAFIFRISGREANEDLPRWANRSSAAHRLHENFDSFAAHYGAGLTRLLLLLFGTPWTIVWRAGRRGARGKTG